MPLVAMLLLLTSCDYNDNWFFHPVKFNGEVEDPKMVLTANLYAGECPVVILNTSFFFLDTVQESVNMSYAGYDGETEYRVYRQSPRGYLTDAVVEMQVDGGEWLKLKVEKRWMPVNSSYYYDSRTSEEMPIYTCDRVLQPGENVAIRASHPKFQDQAFATQKIPFSTHAEVAFLNIDDFSERYQSSYAPQLAVVQLTLPPYQGDTTDVLCIRAKSYSSRIQYYPKGTLNQWNSPNPYNDHDSTIVQNLTPKYIIYGDDYGFAAYENMNAILSHGHYGADINGLYHAVNRSSSPLNLKIWTDYQEYYEMYDNGRKLWYVTDSIVLEVLAVSRDAYLEIASLVAARYIPSPSDYYMRDYWGNSAGDYDDIYDEIMDIFDELGGMEGVQVFGNVEGAFGHVTATNRERFVLRAGVDYETLRP